ncbi:AI-2E family transporter [Shewanella sp. Isolate13]|uniref:AI-2E family transporter n=1 Tax=Shewanella sp. Isolate13 TaxID=2908531 RepID=UPI001EFEC84A|nr:AI-2E family transporter [Shewanella sp. Isolate13]MCG9731850.1 AI-2E family transporter [Shewanella sp. Isolate13]
MRRFENQGVAFKGFAISAFIVVILAGIKAASPIVVPFVLSVFIAVICNPMISWMTRHRAPRGLAVLLLMVFIVMMGLWLASVVGTSINEFSKQLPFYRDQLIDQFSWVVEKLAAFNIQISKEQILAYFDPGVALSMTTNMLSGVGSVMANLFLIILTVVFMLFESNGFSTKMHLALDDPDMRLKQVDRFLHSVNQYMVIKTLVSLGTGLIIGVGLYFIGVDYALLWGVIAFLFNYIPNIGSIIAAIPSVLLAFIQLGPGAAGGVALLYLGTNTVMGNAVEPRYMGKGLGLSTLVVFLSLIFWGWLLGSVGMLLSVPLTMIVKIALESSSGGRWLAVLLGDDVSEAQLQVAKAAAPVEGESAELEKSQRESSALESAQLESSESKNREK